MSLSTVTRLIAGVVAWCCASVVLAGDFKLTDLQGHTHRLASYQGKWVLVNYWATWCSPCLTEIPELNSLRDAHPNLIVLGIAMQSGSTAKVTEFVAAHDMRYPIVIGTRDIVTEVSTAAIGKDKGLEVLPTTLMFGPNGALAYEKVGSIDAQSIGHFLQQASLPR